MIFKVPISNNINCRQKPLIIEFVGPAGAGKSSLAHALVQHNEKVLSIQHPNVREIDCLPFFIWNWTIMSPTFLRLFVTKPIGLSKREIAWIAILNGWHRRLKRIAKKEKAIIVLDQGPVYLFTELEISGPVSLRHTRIRKWWDQVYEQWANTLDIVLWLDASDTSLIERIQTRKKWHLIKNKSELDIREFLSRYRIGYDQVLHKFQVNNPALKILRLDTSCETIEETVKKVLNVFADESISRISDI